MKVFGAKAIVYLKYNGDLKSLAEIISQGMLLPPFYFKSDTFPPHEVAGSCETMGFQVWLEKSNDKEGYQFLFQFETQLSLKETIDNRVHNLSFWAARFISKMCKIDTRVYTEDDDFYFEVVNGNFSQINVQKD